MNSCLYTGRVSHARAGATPNHFRHALYFAAIDLAELGEISSRCRLFSHNRWNLFALRDQDYADATNGLFASISETTREPQLDRVVLVTQLAVLGYVFNPVSFFYCYQGSSLRYIVAEVNNTYGHHKRYVLSSANQTGPATFRTDKALYVSPFIGDDYIYEWRFPSACDPTGLRHDIQMALYDKDRGQKKFFSARLKGQRRSLSDRALIRSFARWPALPAQIIARIHAHAARLRIRGLEYRRPTDDGSRAVTPSYPGRATDGPHRARV